MELLSEPLDQFFLRQFALSGATFTKRIDEGQHLVENRIAQCSGGHGLVQRLEADAAGLTFRPFEDVARATLEQAETVDGVGLAPGRGRLPAR